MNMKSFKPQNLIFGLSLLFTFTFLGYGQQNQRDTSKSLVGFIKKGKLSFHSRTYLMSTLNEGKGNRSEEHTSELQSRPHLVCRLLLEKKNAYQSRPRPGSL